MESLNEGPVDYLRHYVKPTWLMLPFNIIGELSRTIALAVRFYGNIMSGTVIVAILHRRARQNAITSELLDVVSGFEALTSDEK